MKRRLVEWNDNVVCHICKFQRLNDIVQHFQIRASGNENDDAIVGIGNLLHLTEWPSHDGVVQGG